MMVNSVLQLEELHYFHLVSSPQESRTPKYPVCLCVKPLSFLNTDISLRLVEWFETIKAVGIPKVVAYVEGVHANMSKVKQMDKSSH